MKVMGVVLALLLVLVPASRASAQQDRRVKPAGVEADIEAVLAQSGIVAALDSIAAASAPELRSAADQLATTLEALGSRIATDPELRASAVRAATGVVDVAQVLLVEYSSVLQDMLRDAAERIGTMSIPEPDSAAHRSVAQQAVAR